MTSAVITPETKETTPSLTVTISKLSSSSPFPSPGSPFLPPPVPSAHEYALIAPLSKRRSTDSRMNVGSKADHETVPSTNPVGVTNATATAAKSSSSVTKSQPAPDPDKRRESADIITNGSNGLAASPYALEPSKPDSEATVNGQTTPTVPLLNSAGAEAPKASQPSHEGTFNASLSTRSTPDDDAGGTSVSPSTPPLNSHNSSAPDRWCPTTANPSLSRISTTTTTTEDAPKSSLGNPKSPSCTSLRASRDLSLTSSRPAPPSPADSRRASRALSLSRHSSTRSRPGSLSSITPANTHDPEAASPTTPTPIQQQQQHHHQHHHHQQQNAEQRASTSSAVASPQKLIKIRDFAFPDEDVRHTCTGPLTPRPNRRLQRPLSTWSASSASSTGSEDRDDGTGAGLGASSFGFSGWGLGRLGWFGGRGSMGSTGAGDGPSQGDFARNFTELTSPDYEIEDPYDSLDDEDEDDVDEDNATAGRVGVEGHEERPLLPGLYRALYAFEPEGTAEMALEEDQVVRVIGRGGGVGWAIVARDGDDGHALVPEGYLELVSLDRDQVGEEEG